ncbi:MAG: hypothetical protein AAFN30_15115 [Actinomycetota bacterium]
MQEGTMGGRMMAGLAGVIACASLIAGCSFSIGDTPTNAAEEVIEGDLAEQLGLSGLSADCEVPANQDVGTTFDCTSDAEIGEIRWLATIQEDDIVNVRDVNLLTAEQLVNLENAAVDLLEEGSGQALGYENFSCGVAPVVIPADLTVSCELIDPVNGDSYDTDLVFASDEYTEFTVTVAETPNGG